MSSLHRIRWKGRTTGPYSREEIRAKLGAGEFSLLHRVETAGGWIGLDEFLGGDAARPVSAERAAPAPDLPAPPGHFTVHAPLKARPLTGFGVGRKNTNLGYFLCGLSFVLPLVATVPAGWFAWRAREAGDRRQSETLFILAALFTILGLAFWFAVMFAWSRGMI